MTSYVESYLQLFKENYFKPQVLADKIYTSNEFKKVKENFSVSAQYC